MELFEAIANRRSIRQFKPDAPVSEEALNKIFNAAIMAPSAGNHQCWRFIAVKDKALKKRLATDVGHQLFIEHAAVAVVVVADLARAQEKYGERGRGTYALQESAAAAENMLLAARALGLGACWIGSFEETAASQILGIPDGQRPVAIIPIGVPDEPAIRVPPRRRIEDVVEYR